ncbi:CinA family protein [Dactylosporangium aurantiacum]|uniref:CinA family protein n=1 Tax=Dactylosporangium aurantiacum TaxID=35754 RepID=A0A9Q9MLW9_9ACTN|nr:CinA family protein [Dactylosporangium aurantiacum]MDG6104536.1 CinA family protein [Dactylosporangium aurantiacum]UWZ59425.1 CinA family protein [Dactylosporangium aurantiacum]
MSAAEVLSVLQERGETLAVAESLTGGLLAAEFVAVPGASLVFRGGLVAYATDLKAALVGVPLPLLNSHGPVDPSVAAALAAGARDRCGADWAAATTGVAGPDPQAGQPVGRVYVAVAGPLPDHAAVRELTLPGDRAAVRAGAVEAAVTLLAERLAITITSR